MRDKAGNAFSTWLETMRRRRGRREKRGRKGGGKEKERRKKGKKGEVEAWIFRAAVDSRRFDSHAGRAFFARYRNSKERTAVVRESDPNGLIVAAAAAAGSSPRGSIAAVCK